jgi:hypothetical protein
VRGPPAISDPQWQGILAKIGTLPPTADPDRARREIEEAISDFAGRLPDKRLLAERARWRRIDALVSKLAHELLRLKRQTPWTVTDPDWPQESIEALTPLRRRGRRSVEDFDALARAIAGQRDPAREFLYLRLMAIWSDSLGGRLGVSTRRGVPEGPLVRFLLAILAIMRPLMDDAPGPHGIRAIIRREQQRRKGTLKPQK